MPNITLNRKTHRRRLISRIDCFSRNAIDRVPPRGVADRVVTGVFR